MVEHTCDVHEPSRACYSQHACRCEGCLSAEARYTARWNHDRATGRARRVDARPVADRLNLLLSQGATVEHMARHTGLSSAGIRKILRGQVKQVSVDTAKRVSRLEPPRAAEVKDGLVDPASTVARLRALHAIGWSWVQIARELGLSRQVVHGWLGRDKIRASTRQMVIELYEELWDYPSPEKYAERSRRRAARNKWAVPMGLDEDSLDAPTIDYRAVAR